MYVFLVLMDFEKDRLIRMCIPSEEIALKWFGRPQLCVCRSHRLRYSATTKIEGFTYTPVLENQNNTHILAFQC